MKRHANVVWKGSLTQGTGTLNSQSSALKEMPLTFKARFEDESGRAGTNPEELIAAAHAGCFSMQLAHMLAENGTPAEFLNTTAEVEVRPLRAAGSKFPAAPSSSMRGFRGWMRQGSARSRKAPRQTVPCRRRCAPSTSRSISPSRKGRRVADPEPRRWNLAARDLIGLNMRFGRLAMRGHTENRKARGMHPAGLSIRYVRTRLRPGVPP